MGFTKSRFQKSVPPHMIRWDFSVYRNGKRKRATVVCRRREVVQVYAAWEEKALRRLNAGPYTTFFENVDFYLQYARNRKSPRWFRQEVAMMETKFKPFFGDMPVADFRRADIERYINRRLNEGVMPSTINCELNCLGAFFTWATRQEDVNGHLLYDKINPVNGMRLPENNERYIQLTSDQVVEIVERAKSHDILTPVMLAVFAGLRRGEIYTLVWNDIDLEGRWINVRKEHTKSKKRRSVPIPTILHEYLANISPGTGNVVNSPETTLTHRFKKLRSELSFKDSLSVATLRFHDLRHAFAQGLRDAGVILDDIQSFLGHSSVQVTERRYAQSGGYGAADKVERLAAVIDFDRIRKVIR